MANPYHDETGRFCSKDEMQTAIKKLAAKGDLDGYFALRTEYEKIEKNQVTISKDAVRKLYRTSTLIENLQNEEEVSEVYDVLKERILNKEDNSYSTVVSLLESKMSLEEKRELIKSLPADIKVNVLNKIRNDAANRKPEYVYPYTSDMLKSFAEGKVNDSVISELSLSKFLTFEDKYIIADKYPHGLTLLALQQPKLFFSDPYLRGKIRAEAEKAENQKEKEMYAAAFAFSDSPQDLLWAVENSDNWDYPSIFYRIRNNENIDRSVAKALLKKSLTNNIDETRQIISDTARTLSSKDRGYRDAVSQAMYGTVTPFRETPGSQKTNDSIKATMNRIKIESENATGREKSKAEEMLSTYQAVIDSDEVAYKELTKTFNRHDKDKKSYRANPASWRETSNEYRDRLRNAEAYIRGTLLLNLLSK